MSLKRRFVIFMLAFLASAGVLGTGAIYIFTSLGKSLTVLEEEMDNHRALQEARVSIREFMRATTGWALTGSRGYRDLYKENLARAEKNFRALDTFIEDKTTLKALKSDFQELKRLSDGIIAERPQDTAAFLKTLSMIEMFEESISLRLDDLLTDSIESSRGVVAAGKRIRTNMTVYLSLLVLFSFLITGSLALMVQRFIEAPYKEMLTATERVTAGDLSFRIRSGRTDEFGMIAGRFDRMVETLEESEKKAKAKLRETELLLNVARIAGMVPEHREAVGLITKTVAETTGKDLCAIYLLDAGKREFCLSASNISDPALAVCLPLESGIAGEVVSVLKPIIIDDVSLRPGLKDAVCGLCRSFLVVPILRDGSCAGIFLLGDRKPGGFRPDESDTAMILAHNLSVALRNAELYETAKRQVKQLGVLYELGRALTSVYKPDELLKTITTETAKLIGARGCIIRLIEGGDLKVKSFSGPMEELEEKYMSVPLGKGIVGRVALEGRPMLVEDISEVPEEMRWTVIAEKSIVSVPLKVGDRVIGTLGLFDKIGPAGEPVSFSADDLGIAEGFASVSAVTIERARMLALEKEREAEILGAKKRLDLVFESVQGGLITLDRAYTISAANKYVERWIETPLEDIIGRSALDVFHGRAGICPHCAANATFQTGDINVITQSSGLNYAELTSYPIKDGAGNVVESVVFIQDITDRVLYQEEIMGLYREVTQTKDFLESLINSSADAIVTSDLKGIITSWNPAAESIYGYTAEEAAGKFLPFVPDFLEKAELENIEKIKKGESLAVETLRKRKDGRLIEVSLALSPVKDAAGEVIGISGISRDISERKRIEKELIRRNQELSRLFFISSAMRGTLELDRLLRMVLTAVTMSDGLGFNRAILFLLDEGSGRLRGAMGVGPATADEAWSIWERLSLEERTLPELIGEIDESPLRKDSFLDRLSVGLEIPLDSDSVVARTAREKTPFIVRDARAEPLADTVLIQQLGTEAYAVAPLVARNRVIGVIWVDNIFNKRPITDEDMKFLSGFSNQVAFAIEGARLFEQVSRAEAELENIFSSISDMMYFTDPDYNIKRINKAVSDKVGMPSDEIVGRKCYEVFHGMDRPWPDCPHHKTVQKKKPHIEELEDPYMKGTFLTSTSPLFGAEGNFLGTVHIVRNVTELKDLREKLQSAERMAALGEVAAKVAHEIRNPLVSIGGFARRLEGKLEGNLLEYAAIISKEVTRLEAILKEILGFVREARIARRQVVLNAMLEELSRLVNTEVVEKGNALVMDLPEPPVTLIIDSDRMKEALLNILTNANQATDNGTVTLRAYAEAEGAVVEISDTGCGINEEDIPRIFDPFFTTRPAGTGLGLSIAKRIVEEHKGRVSVRSKWPGGGTTFKIYLPLKEA